jgi:Tol biopolymer transport system component/tRNA A-37 threonylcarbamoyl transferase component Bud32
MSDLPVRLTAALSRSYRIERELGQGGMATVYLAEDLKHKRKVALKVLKPELAAVLGAERFVQEITTTAALQHPHILPLFDSGEADGFLYYVMPYIQGETLRAKLDRETQLGIDEAVRITVAVADALDYAHRQGVIHRDIKPENILLHEGRPMVADFGIALAVSAAGGGRMTETGLSLGTPHYMSPEQAMAEKEISARSDVYSLASVLHEMLAGNPPHTGASAQQIIMKIVTEEAAPVTKLRKSVPPNVAAAVAKALEKLPADRFESARAFAEALQNPTFTVPLLAGATPAATGARWKERAAVPLAVTALGLLVLLGVSWARPEPAVPVTRFDLVPGRAEPLAASDIVISPDGSMLAYTGREGNDPPAIYLRRLDGDPEFRKIPGTETSNASPTFSPDSRSIAFRRQSDGTLLRLELAGGGVTTLARLGSELGTFLHWGTEDRIVYSGGPEGLFLVSATGGDPELLAKSAGAARYSFLLPDGSGVLYNNARGVHLLAFEADSTVLLVPDGAHPTYVPTGHLLFIGEGGALFAAPFDLPQHRVTGSPVRVQDRVAASLGQRGYSVSDGGVLVYHEGVSTLADGGTVPNRLMMVDFTGAATALPLPAGRRDRPRFSPNGQLLAYEGWAGGVAAMNIFVFDPATGTNTQLTFDGGNNEPVWSPDGRQIAYAKAVEGKGRDLFVTPADNSGAEALLLSLPAAQSPAEWLPDRSLLFVSGDDAQRDIFTILAPGGTEPKAYLDAPWDELDPRVSPDGGLAAFTSRELSVQEVWIRDFPEARGRWRVSLAGGQAPRWSRDGKFLYYWKALSVAGDSLFRVQVDRTPAVTVRPPEFVMTFGFFGGPRNWDLHPDGLRFVASAAATTPTAASASGDSAAPASRYLVTLNWFAELRGKVSPTP